MLALKYVPLVYLSGPMRSKPEFNYPAFNEASELIRDLGYRVFNPAESFQGETHHSFETYMRLDIRELTKCDFIAFLRESIHSEGAIWEAQIARLLKIPTITINQMLNSYGL